IACSRNCRPSIPGILMSDITTRTRPCSTNSCAYCGFPVPIELQARHRSDYCSISTMPGSSSKTHTVMASLELPGTKWPALGGAVKVFMMNQWQGQCQNHTVNGPTWQFFFWVLVPDGISCKSTADNQLGWGG